MRPFQKFALFCGLAFALFCVFLRPTAFRATAVGSYRGSVEVPQNKSLANGVNKTKTVSAMDVHIDDVGSILKFPIGFSL